MMQAEHTALFRSLMTVVDDDTREQITIRIALLGLRKKCRHTLCWRHLDGYWAQCDVCGLVADATDYKSLIRWPEPEPEPAAGALGTELAAWEPPR
jgi:hypothetical protein